jgi:hypothetical protein
MSTVAEQSLAPALESRPTADERRPWKTDQSLRWALFVAFAVRIVPLVLWAYDSCLRDECTYIKLARRFADGEGMTGSAGWIWAPGYPFLLGILEATMGWSPGMKLVQVPVSLLACVFVYRLARMAFPEQPRTARIAAWMYALSPHMAFFAIRLWSEVLYGTILMGGLILLLNSRNEVDAAPRSGWMKTALTGLMGGICVLFRGVATYMLPIWMFSVLWGRWRDKKAWAQAGLLALVAMLTVAPYSLYASNKFEGRIVSDRTMGQMMWLGNNDFEPITFDYGNGQLAKQAFRRTKLKGRKASKCGSKKNAYTRDKCQTELGFEWILDNPEEFVRRMPMRVAQMLNPHSLLTRHLRWGRFQGMPQWMDELIILFGCLHSLGTMVLGAVGLAGRGRKAQAVLFSLILVYHCAAIAALAGLSRYRVPLEPLLMIYSAGILADPKAFVAAVRAEKWRGVVIVAGLCILMPLVLWYLPAGWPWWRSW